MYSLRHVNDMYDDVSHRVEKKRQKKPAMTTDKHSTEAQHIVE
jgi:hypothetical protein